MATASSTKQQPALVRWIILIGVVVVLGGVWTIANRVPGNASSAGELAPAPIKGHPAPNFTLTTTDGQTVSLTDFKGKPVLLNFWATWCPPCRAETPDLQATHREIGDKLTIIGVNMTSQDGGDVTAFMREFGVTYPVVLDSNGDAARAYNILGLPTSVFIDRNGIISEVFTGAVNKAYVESKVPEL